MNKKIFVIYIGGKHENSLIECHDMRFVVATDIQETHEALRQRWWGLPESLHIDAWGVLESVEDFAISIEEKPPVAQENHLYFVNLGGYDSQQFTELHQNVFVVARDEQEAKRKAVIQISSWESPHRDYLQAVDLLTDVSHLLQGNSSGYVHLKKSDVIQPFAFTCQYTPIGICREHAPQRLISNRVNQKKFEAIVIRHLVFEDLGTFEDVLLSSGYNITYLDAGVDDLKIIRDSSPDLLVVLGGPISVYDQESYPFLSVEIEFLKERIKKNLPVVGICLGAQLLVEALGGRVFSGDKKEIGWSKIILTDHGKQSCFRHLAAYHGIVFHWHGDTFTLPSTANLAASTEIYENQAFTVGDNILAIQFHPELFFFK